MYHAHLKETPKQTSCSLSTDYLKNSFSWQWCNPLEQHTL